MLPLIAARVKNAAAIIIPKLRREPGIGKLSRGFEHLFNDLVKALRDWNVV